MLEAPYRSEDIPGHDTGYIPFPPDFLFACKHDLLDAWVRLFRHSERTGLIADTTYTDIHEAIHRSISAVRRDCLRLHEAGWVTLLPTDSYPRQHVVLHMSFADSAAFRTAHGIELAPGTDTSQ
ncbi:hypothetical protein [Streptomyces sp. CS014]|uniref:hypothetical protein n=1 Tax=Streptomyces sp. CS014 TaxID=2162707 RepID=UPI000D51125B|nr:hypothetical protein [Streptomyces sp. CS014]PVD04426.1 hypothetical protein DBP12_03100 [Streptomyces sp. CS014]